MKIISNNVLKHVSPKVIPLIALFSLNNPNIAIANGKKLSNIQPIHMYIKSASDLSSKIEQVTNTDTQENTKPHIS